MDYTEEAVKVIFGMGIPIILLLAGIMIMLLRIGDALERPVDPKPGGSDGR